MKYIYFKSFQEHKILKSLYKKWEEGDTKSGRGLTYPEEERYLTTINLLRNRRISLENIERLCISLYSRGYIEYKYKDVDNKNHQFLITESGKSFPYIRMDYLEVNHRAFYIAMAKQIHQLPDVHPHLQ